MPPATRARSARATHGGGFLADKSTQLVLDALGRAAGEPAGLSLYAGKSAPGLFPKTALGRAAATRCFDEGFLQSTDSPAVDQAVIITEKGRQFLFDQLDPRQILEDCVRALEAREDQLGDLHRLMQHLTGHVGALKGLVLQTLPRLAQPAEPPTAADCADDVLSELERWHDGGAPEDLPLPDLFCRVRSTHPALTVGGFHDALRRLHDAERVYLHPWTGPLYDLPEPACALLVGHEIAYYASLRQSPLPLVPRRLPAAAR
jgi:hypothetical protein